MSAQQVMKHFWWNIFEKEDFPKAPEECQNRVAKNPIYRATNIYIIYEMISSMIFPINVAVTAHHIAWDYAPQSKRT